MIKHIFIILSLLALMAVNGFAADFTIGKPFLQMGHSEYITGIAITSDGKYVLSGSADGLLKLWDVSTGREIRTYNNPSESRIRSVAISPDDKYALSCGEGSGTQLWDIKAGKIVKIFKDVGWGALSCAFSPDGKHAVLGSSAGSAVKLLNIDTGKVIKIFNGHTSNISSVKFSPDGKQILSGSYDKTVKLWDIQSGIAIRTFKGHSNVISSVAFSPNGKSVLSGSYDWTARVWDIKTGNLIRKKGHRERVTAVAFSPNGKKALSGNNDGHVKLWNVKSGKTIKTFEGHLGLVTSIVFGPKGEFALSGGGDNFLRLMNLQTKKEEKIFKGDLTHITSTALSSDGKYAISASDKEVKIWDIQKGKEVRILKGHSYTINSIDISPDGKFLLSGSKDDTLKLWDIETGKILKTFKGHEWDIRSVAYSSNGKYGASGGGEVIKFWDLSSGKEIKTFKGHTGWVTSISLSPDGKYLLSGSRDKTIKLWDIKTGQILKSFKNDLRWGDTPLTAVVFSSDSEKMASSQPNYVRIWDVKTGKVLRTFSGGQGNLVFSPDGNYLFSGTDDLRAASYSVYSNYVRKFFKGHNGPVESISVSQDGKYLLSGSTDGTLKYWDIQTGKELLTIASFKDGEWISITPEGYFNASANGAKYLNILTGPMEVSSIDQYYDTFYRPDIVAAALKGRKIETGIAIVQVKPAPSVQIVNTVESTDKAAAQVTLKIKESGGGIGDIRLFVNGTAIKSDTDRALLKKRTGGVFKTYSIKLNPGENQIKAIVYNEAGTMNSKDALHTITANYTLNRKPMLHALVVGINTFKNPKLQLNYAVADAQLFADTLKKQSVGLFDTVNIQLINTSEQASKNMITSLLKSFQSLNPDDLFVFYVASHGTVDDGDYFLITSNVGATSTRKLRQDAITQSELKNLIANIPATKKVIVLDTCNAGKMGDTLQMAMLTRGMSEDTAMKVLSRAVGSVVLSAATSQQEALEGYKNHGLFTYVLAEGLLGAADSDKDGFIKTRELSNYVEDEVPILAEKLYNRAQYPVVSPVGQGFPLGRVQ